MSPTPRCRRKAPTTLRPYAALLEDLRSGTTIFASILRLAFTGRRCRQSQADRQHQLFQRPRQLGNGLGHKESGKDD